MTVVRYTTGSGTRAGQHAAAPRALAQRLEPKATWDDLVLPPAEIDLLHQIAAQVGQRSTVYDEWGFRDKMNRGLGISALFAGESGTGKTMAAEVIANELAAEPLPHRPVGGRQQVHRRDREEPARDSSTRPRTAARSCSSTRPTRCSASAARSRTATTATPTSRSTTCCSAWRPIAAWRSWPPT